MRVKLSYTVEAEEVLKESAKILNLCAEDLQQCVNLFREVQAELIRTDDTTTNVPKAIDMIDEFRQALLVIDTRLLEVSDIVVAYDGYRRDLRNAERAAPDVATLEETT